MITITIQYNEQTGQVQVTGPVQNKIMFYGLLDTVKEIISRQPSGKILVPDVLVTHKLNGENGQ